MISKGFCIIYEEITDSNVLTIAATLGSSYLVYSISLINTSLFGIFIVIYLLLIAYIINKGCNKILFYLQNKHDTLIQRRRLIEMINKRIFRYRMFKRLAYFYFVSQGLALATAFIIELSVGSYQLYV